MKHRIVAMLLGIVGFLLFAPLANAEEDYFDFRHADPSAVILPSDYEKEREHNNPPEPGPELYLEVRNVPLYFFQEAPEGTPAELWAKLFDSAYGGKWPEKQEIDATWRTRIDASMPIPTIEVHDRPDDSGDAVEIVAEWLRDDGGAFTSDDFVTMRQKVETVELLRADDPAGPWTKVADVSRYNHDRLADLTYLHKAYYRVMSVRGRFYRASDPIGPVEAHANWFHFGRINLLLAGLFLAAAILFYIRKAKSGGDIPIRRIHGLEAIDDAIGRATEMGRKILFVPGIMDVDDPQTIAGLTILGHVARYSADYHTELEVPVSRSMVMVTGREVVKEAYLKAGAPEEYREDAIHYLTDDQFGFAAGVDGIIVREKPATIFFQGSFFAESLILAETGHSVGAVQIAGTAQVTQLPFFITACDYTLIGEELYAASAYLSKEPKLLGSLKGQDLGKAVALVFLAFGVGVATLGSLVSSPFLVSLFHNLLLVAD